MRLRELALRDFRSYVELDLALPEGLTCVVGENGIGKTNLLEAIGYLVQLESFRGADNPTMVRIGADRAFVRVSGRAKVASSRSSVRFHVRVGVGFRSTDSDWCGLPIWPRLHA